MENASIDNIICKCRKEVTYSHKKRLCKWSGVLSEFVDHIKNKHDKSYHIMKKKRIMLRWQLPQTGNQEIKGIMNHSAGDIFYKMCYIWDMQSLVYSAHNLHESNRRVTFNLILESKYKNYVTPPCETLNINSINDSILNAHNIVIHKDVLEDFLDPNRYFELKFKIID